MANFIFQLGRALRARSFFAPCHPCLQTNTENRKQYSLCKGRKKQVIIGGTIFNLSIFVQAREKNGAWDFPDKEDVMMRRWLALVVALGAVLLWAGSSWSAERVVITGIISNWKEIKAKIPETAYFQLVKYRSKMKGTTDQAGFSAFDSKLPKIKVRDDGSFKLSIKALSEGKYFIALQRAIPKEIYGEDTEAAVPILVTGKEALVIEVPGEFPVNVGKVFVAVRTKKEKEPPASDKGQKEAPAPEKTEKKSEAPEKK